MVFSCWRVSDSNFIKIVRNKYFAISNTNAMKEKEIQIIFEKWLENYFKGVKIAFYKAPYYGRTRWDIFGVFDYVVVNNFGETYYFQITTVKHISDRRKKIKEFYKNIGFEVSNAYILGLDKVKEDFKIEKC